MTLLLQQLLDPVYRFLPTHVLLDSQAFERLDCSFGGALRLQKGLEDVEVIVEPFQILLLDGADPLEYFVGVEDGFRGGERVGGSGGRLAVDESEVACFDANHWRFVPGSSRSTSSPSRLTWTISRTDLLRGMVTLSPISGIGGGSGAAGWAVGFLRGLAMTP
jgi:hypothetical protein